LKGVTGLEGEMASALARDALTGSISEDTGPCHRAACTRGRRSGEPTPAL
jgi:hypothetical protein